MPAVNCVVCGVEFNRFKFSHRDTCSKNCYRRRQDANIKKTVTCANCGKDFQVGVNVRRVTCDERCHRELMVRNANLAAVKREQEAAEVEQRRQQLRVVGGRYATDAEPRRKCPCCGQRVRLFRSVSGAIWLRAHKSGEEMCDGSRFVVSYPNERKAEQCSI